MDLLFGSLTLFLTLNFAAIFPSKYTSIPATTVIYDFYPDLLFALFNKKSGYKIRDYCSYK